MDNKNKREPALDVVFGTALIIFGIYIVITSLGLKYFTSFIDGAGFFPCIIGSCLTVFGIVLLYTARIRWLSMGFSIFGAALAVFYWGLFVQPVIAYLRYLYEIIGGRSHKFTGELTEIAQDSVREGVPCKTLFFCDDAGDAQRLCYLDQLKHTEGSLTVGTRYRVTVHGQSILALAAE